MENTWFDALARLSRAAASDGSVQWLLHELCEVVPLVLPGTFAGVMRVNNETPEIAFLELVHAHPGVVSTELVQHSLGTGPCHETLRTAEVVAIGDLETVQERWPALVKEARTSGLHAVVSLPLRSRGRFSGALSLYRATAGTWSSVELTTAQVLADVAVAYIKMAQDRDDAMSAQSELSHRALHDDLTGLPNRTLLFDRMGHAVTRARRNGTTIAAVFLDLDRFKQINDTYGHACGDAVLVEVAGRLVATARTSDTVARLSGDEFVVLCEDLLGEPDDLHRLMEEFTARLNAALAEPIRHGPNELVISASAGAALLTEESTVLELLHVADAAMYIAKERGPGNVVVHDHDQGVTSDRASHLTRELASAADRGELRLHYQPIYAAHTSRIHSVEALVRWQHPSAGLLTAHDFIGLADTDTIGGIGAWVTEAACTQLAAWRRELGEQAPRTVFCNISPRELVEPGFHDLISATLRRHDLEPQDLGLEILEEVFSYPSVLPTLTHCQASGHLLSVDDFGTGYSSLSRLVELPVHYAKMDRSFIAGLPDDPRARSLVNAVLVLAKGLNLSVIGEGVETAAQRDYLTSAGCELLQGYHLATPAPAHEISTLLYDQLVP